MENGKIDICINVYGKPWQTLVTLKSLLQKSSNYIDKIYFIEEKNQPYNEDISWVINELNYEKLIYFKPKHHLWISPTNLDMYVNDYDYRNSLRYQYGIENTDKKYLLIIHNDILFESDIINPFINNIGDCFGIGQIGQCWNCPMFYEKICDGEKYNETNFTYSEAMTATVLHPKTRTHVYKALINRINPKPMPECRINEWCCLIDIEKYKKEVIPNGNVLPFGGYFKVDLADAWFQGMVNNGYKPAYYNIYQNIKHGYFSETKKTTEYCLNSHNGHSALSDFEKYKQEENEAKKIYYGF